MLPELLILIEFPRASSEQNRLKFDVGDDGKVSIGRCKQRNMHTIASLGLVVEVSHWVDERGEHLNFNRDVA
jgi:hypothetical protein